MNKKGTTEMSVGTIVTIVLLMSVLVLGIFLAQKIFTNKPTYQVTENVCHNKAIYSPLHNISEQDFIFEMAPNETVTKSYIMSYLNNQIASPSVSSGQICPYDLGSCANYMERNNKNYTIPIIINIYGDFIRVEQNYYVRNLKNTINTANVSVILQTTNFVKKGENKTCEQEQVNSFKIGYAWVNVDNKYHSSQRGIQTSFIDFLNSNGLKDWCTQTGVATWSCNNYTITEVKK